MRKMAAPMWNVYVGSRVGLLKGVNTEKKTFENLNSLTDLNKENEITAMCWGDASENKIYIGQKDHTVKVYDSESHNFTNTYDLDAGDGSLKGLSLHNGNIITAVDSGVVKVWDQELRPKMHIQSGSNLCQMRQNKFNTSHIATGGDENNLKVWDLQRHKTPIFKAMNVPNDFLDLRVPVWVMDMQFRPDNKIVTCSRYHQVRLYDPKAQRQPVIDMEFERFPLMCLSLSHRDNQIVVGSSRGRMALIDIRRKLLVHVFKGFAGSIRHVQCHESLPLVASCGLDRFLRIHELNKHLLLKKIYLKTQLNCLLMNSSVPTPIKIEKIKEEPTENDNEDEKFWTDLKVVSEKSAKKKKTEIKTEDNASV